MEIRQYQNLQKISKDNLVEVLDNGYVRLVDHMGNDLTVSNTARTSFAKEKDKLDEKDENLISFLVDHNHASVFRHNVFTFEVHAPLMVVRQRSTVGSQYN